MTRLALILAAVLLSLSLATACVIDTVPLPENNGQQGTVDDRVGSEAEPSDGAAAGDGDALAGDGD